MCYCLTGTSGAYWADLTVALRGARSLRLFSIAAVLAGWTASAPVHAATWDLVSDAPTSALYARRLTVDPPKAVHHLEFLSVAKPRPSQGVAFALKRAYASCADERAETTTVREYGSTGQLIEETKYKSYDPAKNVPHQWRSLDKQAKDVVMAWRWACGQTKSRASVEVTDAAELVNATWRGDAPTAAAEQEWGIPRHLWAIAADGDLWRAASRDPARVDLRSLTLQAEGGEPIAQTLLGMVFESGLGGVTQNHTMAVSWYQKAAASGFARARHNLAFMLMEGRGVAQDRAKAVALYRDSAEAHLDISAFRLGVALVEGSGTPKQPVAGATYVASAAAGGVPDAHAYLGSLYERGLGVTQDRSEAARHYARAFGVLGRDELLQKLAAVSPTDPPNAGQVYRSYRRFGALSSVCRDGVANSLLLKVSQQALSKLGQLPRPHQDHTSIIFDAAAERARLFAVLSAPSGPGCETALEATSAAMLVPVADARAQSAPSTAAQQSAFEDFKALLESNRVAWKGARTQPYRVATQSISGTSCAPIWAQVRVNTDGRPRVVERFSIDWNKVSGVSSRGTSVVTFDNGSDGEIGIQTSSPATADRLVASMEALRSACSKPTPSAGSPSGELTSLITEGRYTLYNALGRAGQPDDWTMQRVIVRAEDQDRCTTRFVAGDMRSSPNIRPASSYVLSWKSVSDVWSDKADVKWRASHMAPSETARLDVSDPTSAKRLADHFKARAQMCGAVLRSGASAPTSAPIVASKSASAPKVATGSSASLRMPSGRLVPVTLGTSFTVTRDMVPPPNPSDALLRYEATLILRGSRGDRFIVTLQSRVPVHMFIPSEHLKHEYPKGQGINDPTRSITFQLLKDGEHKVPFSQKGRIKFSSDEAHAFVPYTMTVRKVD